MRRSCAFVLESKWESGDFAWRGVIGPARRHAHATRTRQTAASSPDELAMNVRFALPLTAAVSFALTCGVLLWNRRDGAEAVAHAEAAAPDPALTTAPPPLVPSALAPASISASSPATVLREMPIQLTMRALPAANSYFGAVVDTAAGSLMIDVVVSSPQSHRTQSERIRLEAGTRAKFGVDDGLMIQAGDRVTLHSGGYADVVTQLPTLELESGSDASSTPQ
jgi:hypothetical protein